MKQSFQIEDQIHHLKQSKERTRDPAMCGRKSHRSNGGASRLIRCIESDRAVILVYFPSYVGNETVSSPRKRFNETRTARRVAKRFSNLVDRSIQAVIEVSKGIRRPKLLPEFLSQNCFAGSLEQEDEYCKRLVLEAESSSLFAQFVSVQVNFKDAEARAAGLLAGFRGSRHAVSLASVYLADAPIIIFAPTRGPSAKFASGRKIGRRGRTIRAKCARRHHYRQRQ